MHMQVNIYNLSYIKAPISLVAFFSIKVEEKKLKHFLEPLITSHNNDLLVAGGLGRRCLWTDGQLDTVLTLCLVGMLGWISGFWGGWVLLWSWSDVDERSLHQALLQSPQCVHPRMDHTAPPTVQYPFLFLIFTSFFVYGCFAFV